MKIARKPIREKLICQKEVAKKKEESKAMISLFLSSENNSLTNKYIPKTVRIPMTAETILIDQMLSPKIEKEKASKLIYRPSLPLFSG